MKSALPIFICILIISCTPKKKEPVIRNYNADLISYSLNRHSDSGDTIFNNKSFYKNIFHFKVRSSIGDTVTFIYYHEQYMDYNDTLTIYKNDSVVLRKKMHLLDQKAFNFKGKPLLIKKYLQSVEPYGPFSNVYVNDSLGIVLTRSIVHPYGERLMRWDAERYFELQKAMINDTVFTQAKYW